MEGPHPPMADGVPPSTPSQVPAERGSLTAEPAGRCPGAAAPGRAGGWGSLVPPRRGDGDILRLPRHRSCRETEPRGGGTGSPHRHRELPASTPAHPHHDHPKKSSPPAHGWSPPERPPWLWRGKGSERYCWRHLLPSKARGALKISARGMSPPSASGKEDAKPDRDPGTDGGVQAGEVEPRGSISINPTACCGQRSLHDPYSPTVLPKSK